MTPEDRQRAVLAWLLTQPEDSAHSALTIAWDVGFEAGDALDTLVATGHAYRYRENGAEVYCASMKALREARKT